MVSDSEPDGVIVKNPITPAATYLSQLPHHCVVPPFFHKEGDGAAHRNSPPAEGGTTEGGGEGYMPKVHLWIFSFFMKEGVPGKSDSDCRGR